MARSDGCISAARHAGLLEPIGRRGQQRVDVEDVARRDPQHGLRLGPVVAVGDRRRRRLEAVGARRARLPLTRVRTPQQKKQQIAGRTHVAAYRR